MPTQTIRDWALEEFKSLQLGDARRRARLLNIASAAVDAPSGKISEMFSCPRRREGAYDFFQNPHVKASALIDASGMACVERCVGAPYVFVAVDGSSITLTDTRLAKDFGALGSRAKGRGVKSMIALVIDSDGVPVGVCDQQYWARPARTKRTRSKPRNRPVAEKETQRWLDAITATSERFSKASASTRLWFVIDREGSSWPILEASQASGHLFTIRASRDRLLRHDGNRKHRLRAELKKQAPVGSYRVHVTAAENRTQRSANVEIRVRHVTLDIRDAYTHARRAPLTLTAVWIREKGSVPRGEAPLDWMLLTNADAETPENVERIVFSYAQRWRIEDFHRTWKSGRCGIEQTQLRRKDHVIKLAGILAAVAARTERLKHLARNEPKTPASVELNIYELNALIMLKREIPDRLSDVIPSAVPSIADATMWIAQLGGYIRQKSNGPPGSITIGRGLKTMQVAARVLRLLGHTPILKSIRKPKRRQK
jgi:Transposase DNA-binding